jgi:transcription antitermination factor NusG
MLMSSAFNPPHAVEANWYAAYVCSNHERRVAEHLAQRGLEFFLPLYRTFRKRKQRRVQLSLPLFPGYIFVRLALQERRRVLEVPRVVSLLGEARPAVLAGDDIERLRNGLSGEVHAEPCRYLTRGCQVRVVNGPLSGYQGILMRHPKRARVAIAVEAIARSFAVELSQNDLERI